MAVRYLSMVGAFFGILGVILLLRPSSGRYDVAPLQTNIQGLSDYRESLVHYATVTRPDNRTRDIFISSGAAQLVANNSTARLPDGTVIVIETHYATQVLDGTIQKNGIADNVHVAVKRDNWALADYQTEERAGDWNYFSFDPTTGVMTNESIFECFDCHSNNSQIDFIFSRDELAIYGSTGTPQTVFCNRPDRRPC